MRPILPLSALLLATTSLALAGCSKSDDAATSDTIAVGAVDAGCDPLTPTYCGFPFPSDRYTVADASSPTGKRVAFPQSAMPRQNGQHVDPASWNGMDGFSTGATILAHLPGAVADALTPWKDIGRSLAADATTVILDATTGERVPSWAEIDMSGRDDDTRALLIQPARRLSDATRYIVAVRNVTDATGAKIAPSPAFQALRDGKTSDNAEIEARRAAYDDLFAKLDAAGFPRGELQLAWDFTTSSRTQTTGWLVKMRDEALATVGDQGPEYVIDKVIPAPSEHVARRIEGHFTVPSYLTGTDARATLNLGTDGQPKQNGTASFPFVVVVPNKLVTDSAGSSFAGGALVQNAHGLLGDYEEGVDSYLALVSDTFGYVAFATPLVGMDGDDIGFVTDTVTSAIGDFGKIVGRQHQGMLNELLLMRMMKGRFVSDPNVQENGKPLIDPTRRYYRGNSQGGIFGATYMALSTDVTRGLLGDMGAPYSLLLWRSQDFGPFFTFLRVSMPDAFDLAMTLGLIQMHWDKTEPNGFVGAITSDMLPNTPAHATLQQSSIGDHQVSLLGGQYVARTVGAKTIQTPVREIYGVPDTATPFTGSAYVEYDFGTPEGPVTNVPNTQGADPHEDSRKHPPAYQQADHFFQTGEIQNFCANGKCNPG